MKRQIAVNGDEDVEVFRRKREQLSVLYRRPAHLTGGLYLMASNVSCQPPINALIAVLSRRSGDQAVFRLLEKLDHLLSCHGWEAAKEVID